MAIVVPLDLSSKEYRISANAGNDLNFAFVFVATDTTGYTFEFRIYEADGTTLITTLTNGNGITNTPVSGGGNSNVAIAIGVAINTPARKGTQVVTQFWRVDTGDVRTFAAGPIVLI